MSDLWADPDFVLDEREAAGERPGTRRPIVGQSVIVYGDRLTVLAIRDRGQGPLVVTEDDAGARIERPVDRLTWDADAWAWR